MPLIVSFTYKYKESLTTLHCKQIKNIKSTSCKMQVKFFLITSKQKVIKNDEKCTAFKKKREIFMFKFIQRDETVTF